MFGSFLGVFLGWIGFLIILLTRREDKFAMFYAKYGLVLSIAWVVVYLVGMLPFIGWLIYIVGGDYFIDSLGNLICCSPFWKREKVPNIK